MKVIQLTPVEQAGVKVLQDAFKAAQLQHINSYKALLVHLQSITGVHPDEPGKRAKWAVSDDGQNIVVV